jgi:DNA repair protein RecO (recombination protein O)
MSENVAGVVIGREEWGEYDCLLTIYTRERGKVEAVARGVRKSSSKLAAHLEPLSVAELLLVRGRRRHIVAGSVATSLAYRFAGNAASLTAAGAVVRLVDDMTPLEVPDQRIFTLLEVALALVASQLLTVSQRAFLVRCVAWQLLVLSGYQPELRTCVICRRPANDASRKLDARRGGVVHSLCATPHAAVTPLGTAALRGLAYMASAPLDHLVRLRARAVTFAEMMRAIEQLVEERFEVTTRHSVWLPTPQP